MSNPWEEYSQKAASPWEEYAPAVEDKDAENYIQEMHPDVSVADRALAKNFSKDEATTMQFLQTRYPNMDIEKRAGQIFMKNRGEKQFRAFDPEGWGQYATSPLEALRDVGDVVYDVGAGVAEGAAAAAAGVAALPAAPATLGTAPVAAAMAAGGATGTAAEYLRQKAGMIMGLPQEEVSGTDLATAGAVGAAGPLLFGTGGVIKNATKTMTKEAAQEAQRGILKRGYDTTANKAFPAAMEFLGGTPAEATRTLKKEYGKLQELVGNELPFAEETHAKIITDIKKAEKVVGSKVSDALDSAKNGVDIREVKKKFLDDVATYEKDLPRTADGVLTEESQASIEQLRSVYNNLFTGGEKEVTKLVMGENGVLSQVKEKVKQEVGDVVTAKEAFNLQDQLKDVAQMFKNRPDVGGPGASIADRKGREVGNAAYHSMNQALDTATSGLSGQAKKDYAAFKLLTTKITPNFKDVDTTYKTLTNSDRQTRKLLLQRLEAMDASYGTQALKEAKTLQAHKIFADPSIEAISNGGSNTGRNMRLKFLGTGAGIGLGGMTGIPGAEVVGGFVGGTTAGYLGSPAAVKRYVGIQNLLEQKAGKVTPSAKKLNMSVPSVWNMMDERE